ncbi:biotin transporter BioY, partial [Lactobacillus delbrueckii subsp. bulgaricus]|nr:biotin transporter BioY [Lactobacillus delbrueckii subsp. bulgaricus]
MSRKNTFQLCLLALSIALIIVGSQLAVPLPGGVPFTLQTLVIPLIAAAFGWQLG